jgi:hypothetical protein
MKAVLRISLYSYLYLKLAKMLCLYLFISYSFSSTKLDKRSEYVLLGNKEGWKGGEVGGGQVGEMAQTMYTHMNKCINNKKRKKIRQIEKGLEARLK